MNYIRKLFALACLIMAFSLLTSCSLLQMGIEPTPTQALKPTLQESTEELISPTSTQGPLPTESSQPSETTVPTPTKTATPVPSPTPAACTDKIKFGIDVTIPDDTRLSPGEKFTKTWRLTNAGTCIWNQNYTLRFIDGDQMSGESSIQLTATVSPSQTVDISANLVAPASIGTYRGNWMLFNDKNQQFGLGVNGDKPFWVQIIVGATAPDIVQSLGNPTFTDQMNTADNWFLLDTPNTKFSMVNNKFTLTSLKAGQLEEWDLATLAPLKDFYIEARFTTGDVCAGLDRYGLLLRAPDPNQGYVFGFSCDGRYRLYIWDGKHYNAIQEWKSSPSINQGPNQTNRLGFWAKGDSLKLYANGILLAEFKDATYLEGRVGLFIGSGVTDNFTVTVNQVSYWVLGQ